MIVREPDDLLQVFNRAFVRTNPLCRREELPRHTRHITRLSLISLECFRSQNGPLQIRWNGLVATLSWTSKNLRGFSKTDDTLLFVLILIHTDQREEICVILNPKFKKNI